MWFSVARRYRRKALKSNDLSRLVRPSSIRTFRKRTRFDIYVATRCLQIRTVDRGIESYGAMSCRGFLPPASCARFLRTDSRTGHSSLSSALRVLPISHLRDESGLRRLSEANVGEEWTTREIRIVRDACTFLTWPLPPARILSTSTFCCTNRISGLHRGVSLLYYLGDNMFSYNHVF